MVAHSIPVGGDEPMHFAGMSCWCFPWLACENDSGLIVHNAQDCREVLERQGHATPGRAWINVGEAAVTLDTTLKPQ